MAFLSYLPTLVLGTSGTNRNVSGIQNLMKPSASRWSRSSSSVSEVSVGTTHASGRSSHVASSMPTTVASATFGCSMREFSRSIVEIHSPPDLIRSLERSLRIT
ncbi:hypothetical protein BJF90_24215 [Pseudonocardia sp. CNS-004]|nr:hypothetical protein BJF90_24215 [Pseudonocardia sp. CNS-004]